MPCRGACWRVFACVMGLALAAGPLIAAEPSAPAGSLAARIDALLDAAAVGPVAPLCSDADFVRRVWLDVAGLAPSAAEAKAFLADESADKRVRLIDRLLASELFARNMTLVWDAVLMERRGDKVIKTPEFQQFLYQSFAADKPLDQLFREMVASDGEDAELRPAARFFLDRDCEPNLVTRDLGRIFFGMDLQCAQCHDHPLVNDYMQEDYYGLFAFVTRTGLFTDTKTKRVLAAEKGEGEASFKSVFTGASADRVLPRIPRGLTAFEPPLAKGEEYVVKPAKDVRPVPKFSRRAELAAMLTDSEPLRRNLANRLWAQVMGRGLVHPVDAHHPDNPPSHPELLSLLADELAAQKFSLRGLLRELLLTRAYQRSSEAPAAEPIDRAQLAERKQDWEAEKQQLDQDREKLLAAYTEATTAWTKARDAFARQSQEIAPLTAAVAAAEKAQQTAREKLQAEAAAAKAEQARKVEQQQLLDELAAKAKAAAEKIPDDKLLAQAAGQLAERARAIAQERAAADKKAADLASQSQSAQPTPAVVAAQAALAKASAGLATADQVRGLELAQRKAWREMIENKYRAAALEARASLAGTLLEHAEAAGQDAETAERLWGQIVEACTNRQQIAPLRALSAEQFSLSLMQATGQWSIQQAAAQAALEKAPPAELKAAADADKPQLVARLAEPKLYEAVRGQVTAFVNLYGGQPGQDFQATVNQALYFGNGALVDAWLKPAAGNLIDRLQKTEEPAPLADELYLSVFSRYPTDSERQAAADFLRDRSDDRLAALQEMAWGLLASNEFRFNH